MTCKRCADMRLRLPERMQAGQSEELLASWRSAPLGASPEVDISAVTKVDTAGAQLLVSLIVTCPALTWLGTSKPLSDAVALLGLGEVLRLPRGQE